MKKRSNFKTNFDELEVSLRSTIEQIEKKKLIDKTKSERELDNENLPKDPDKALEKQLILQADVANLVGKHKKAVSQQCKVWGIYLEEIIDVLSAQELFRHKEQELFNKLQSFCMRLESPERAALEAKENEDIIKKQRKQAKKTKYIKQRRDWHQL